MEEDKKQNPDAKKGDAPKKKKNKKPNPNAGDKLTAEESMNLFMQKFNNPK